MAVEDVPQWVDKVYSAEMLTQFYDYYGNPEAWMAEFCSGTEGLPEDHGRIQLSGD